MKLNEFKQKFTDGEISYIYILEPFAAFPLPLHCNLKRQYVYYMISKIRYNKDKDNWKWTLYTGIKSFCSDKVLIEDEKDPICENTISNEEVYNMSVMAIEKITNMDDQYQSDYAFRCS